MNKEEALKKEKSNTLYTLLCSVFSRFNVWLKCKFFKNHNWTSKTQQGIKPTKEDLTEENILLSFYEFAKMYCKDCGEVSNLSKQMLCKYKNLD
jgi:hypothetical protein